MKIKVKYLSIVPDETIRKASLLGLVLDASSQYQWIDGKLYEVSFL